MSDIVLSQEEADRLIAIEKRFSEPTSMHSFPPPTRHNVTIPLESLDGREGFVLDLYRGRIDIGKQKYQTRGHKTIVLVRLDWAGSDHVNPDESRTRIPCPHVHIYREGFGDRWAFSLQDVEFGSPTDAWDALQHFLAFCNIRGESCFQRGMGI